ncbi:UBP-type zinc finger domain-containing protein [Streptomyces sp. NBC_01217]|uniref:UBP-type zinc finger domain-containing protein n=1 Tax=Streptomyces sp. NBC_01217 TaxID=2903779 RepID=UPI002E1358EA|nr:UBP-type zinc finger domain-containing protein [Streptomyces sp. NBC_01217]
MSECPHVPELPRPEPAPLSATCLGCLEAGTHPVQLRLCLLCGHVGCCDSSPLQHATGHFKETGHPVMRSFEAGENWRWCFEHGSIV